MTLPSDFWQNERRFLQAIIGPRLQRLAIAGVNAANTKLEGMGIYFDTAMAHADAADWARQYTDTLLNQLGTTSQRVIGEMVAGYAETPGMTIGQLVEQLKPVLDDNAVRAWRVSVTETTRAFAAGNNAAYQRAGIPPMKTHAPLHVNCRCTDGVKRLPGGDYVVVFLTSKDDITCTRPIDVPGIGRVNGCRAMQGVIISEGPYFGKKVSEI